MSNETYETKSIAPWAFLLAAVVATAGIAQAVLLWGQEPLAGFVGLAVVLGAYLLANFGVLTVRVTKREVRWFFGTGWIGRRLSLERLRAVEARRSPWYWGWGIRWTPSGWLWRAHGLDAVWLEREDGKRVGIGTQDPTGLAAALEARIGART